MPSVLRTVDDLLSFRKSASLDADEPFRIAGFEVFTTYFLGAVIGRSFKSRPINVRESIPGEMERLVAEGHADIGITYLPIPHADVDLNKIGRVKMGIFGLKGRWRNVRVEDIPFVVPVAPLHGTPSGVQGLDGWPEHLFSRRILYRVEMMETALQICKYGAAAAFLPEFVVKLVNLQSAEHLRLSEVSMPDKLRAVWRDVFMVQRKGFQECKEIREIAKSIRSLE